MVAPWSLHRQRIIGCACAQVASRTTIARGQCSQRLPCFRETPLSSPHPSSVSVCPPQARRDGGSNINRYCSHTTTLVSTAPRLSGPRHLRRSREISAGTGHSFPFATLTQPTPARDAAGYHNSTLKGFLILSDVRTFDVVVDRGPPPIHHPSHRTPIPPACSSARPLSAHDASCNAATARPFWCVSTSAAISNQPSNTLLPSVQRIAHHGGDAGVVIVITMRPVVHNTQYHISKHNTTQQQ